MSKRAVRVKLSFVVDCEDDRDGLPAFGMDPIVVVARVIPGATYIHPGAKTSLAIARHSSWDSTSTAAIKVTAPIAARRPRRSGNP